MICIAQAELPSLLALNQLAEALLRVKHCPWLLCQLVANAPDVEKMCQIFTKYLIFWWTVQKVQKSNLTIKL